MSFTISGRVNRLRRVEPVKHSDRAGAPETWELSRLVSGSAASQGRGSAPGLGGSAPTSLASWAGGGGAGGVGCAALPPGARGKIIRREQNYFAGHAGRMNHQRLARRGWPIGSGAVESGCRTRQCRRQRPGQFWTAAGLRHLDALEEARDNGHWDQLWLTLGWCGCQTEPLHPGAPAPQVSRINLFRLVLSFERRLKFTFDLNRIR